MVMSILFRNNTKPNTLSGFRGSPSVMIYFLNIEIKPNKVDEFFDSMQSFTHRIRKNNECLDFNLYLNSEKENS